MRLLIAGNLANTGYYLVSKLREKGFDVELLMEENPDIASDPNNSGFFKSEHSSWIKFYNKSKRNWKFNILKIMRKYDLIIAITELPMFAFLSLKPYIAICTGSDLIELAQSKSFKGYLLRMSYFFAKKVVYIMPIQKSYAKKIGLKNSLFLPLFRLDYKKEKTDVANKKNNNFIIFHPTNHFWRFKHNEIFLKAFIELTKHRKNVFLITIKRGIDAEKSIKLLKSANIENKYKILPKSLDQKNLFELYLKADLIADQFGLASFGLIGLEVLKLGKPLLCYINEEEYKQEYGEKPPVLSSQNSDEILKMMKEVIDDSSRYNEISDKSLKWYKKYHNEDVLIEKYIKLIKSI